MLEGERDNDLRRNLSASMSRRLNECLEGAIGGGWLKSKIEGNQLFQTVSGPLGGAGFTLRQILQNGGLIATEFKIQADVAKWQAASIDKVRAGPGVSFSHSMTQYGRVGHPPKTSFKMMSKWDRHGIQCAIIRLDPDLFPFAADMVEDCVCPTSYLRPVFSGAVGSAPSWMCICCGAPYVCSCAEGILERFVRPEVLERSAHGGRSPIVPYRDQCCHLCRRLPSEIQYRHEMYGGPIYQYYWPYIQQEAALHGLDHREAENRVRERLGVPRIGEGWVSEMLLINTLRSLFPVLEVEHQASPPWLGRQRFDGYIAQHKIAIEYNGEQHYYPIERFGGKEGLRRTQERDREKLRLAAENGVEVIVLKYDQKLSEAKLRKLVEAAMSRQAERCSASG